MSLSILLYLPSGAALFAIGLHGLFARRHLVRRVIGLNIAGSGVFMIFCAVAARGDGAPDPIPQALVITGLVVAVSATALALGVVVRLYRETGSLTLDGSDVVTQTGREV
jgi:multicomponent Na+:H+ antiporter subunit C